MQKEEHVQVPVAQEQVQDELFDLLTEEGKPTGRRKERKLVHRDGKQRIDDLR